MSNISIMNNGSVEYKWVKKIIPRKDFSHYDATPAYHTLNQSDNGKVVAFKYLIETDNPLPNHLDYCNEFEIRKLEQKLDERRS